MRTGCWVKLDDMLSSELASVVETDTAVADMKDPRSIQSMALGQGTGFAKSASYRKGLSTLLSHLPVEAEFRADRQIRQLVQQSVSHAPLLQQHRVAVIQHPPQVPPDVRAKLLHGLLKHLRAIGKWWRVMIELDAKGFCAMEGVTAGVGWWWGEVGGVVAGSDGAVDAEGEPVCLRLLCGRS